MKMLIATAIRYKKHYSLLAFTFLYLWLMEIPALPATAIVVGFSALVFVPFKYVYPSHLRVLRRSTALGALLCALLVAGAIAEPELGRSLYLVEISLLFPAWYVLLSLRLGGLLRSPV